MIICGDALEELKKLDGDSVDLICTDPPYGYSFMGKDWDRAVPSVEVWRECLRVLKPGAFCMVMSAPRSDVQMHMISNLEQAGFRIDFTPIYWTYASGFPKAGNIGKMVDKRNGREPEQFKALGKYLRELRGNTPQKEISKHFPSRTGRLTGCVANWELGLNVPTIKQWAILKTLLPIDSRFDELIEREEAEREILASRTKARAEGSKSAMPTMGAKTEYIEVQNTAPATDQAKALDGSYAGFQPKPAVEVIIVAMKPLSEKTFVDQALKNGKGVSWLDDCRVPTDEIMKASTTPDFRDVGRKVKELTGQDKLNYNNISNAERIEYIPNTQGRFPANLLVSDDVLNDGRTQKSGKAIRKNLTVSHFGQDAIPQEDLGYGDSGSYSRYFDLDKWANQLPFLIVPKASKSEKNKGLEGFEEKMRSGANKMMGDAGVMKTGSGNDRTTHFKNHHPTVKPLRLMSYLVTLGSRKGDTVLDPFVGSGTTCLAAKHLGREYIGIEKEPEYVEIAEARLNEITQSSIFE